MFNRKPRLCDAFAMSTTPGKPNDGVELTLGIESEKGGRRSYCGGKSGCRKESGTRPRNGKHAAFGGNSRPFKK